MVQALSSTAWHVSRIAVGNGDRTFLLVDKVRGKIALFENSQLAVMRAALTGENLADSLPPDIWRKSYAEQLGVKYKVTPAGRFTVSPGYDDVYGGTLNFNELQGPDWDIAIHRVALGSRSQHRDARLRSANDLDKHITDGCVDVDPSTIAELLRHLPKEGKTPIYVLPFDETLIPRLFSPLQSARGMPALAAVR